MSDMDRVIADGTLAPALAGLQVERGRVLDAITVWKKLFDAEALDEARRAASLIEQACDCLAAARHRQLKL